MKKVALMGAAFDTTNLGVSVLAASAIRNVKRTYPGAEVYLFNYARTPEVWPVRIEPGQPPLPIRLEPIRFSKWLLQSNNILFLIALACLARLWPPLLRRNHTLRELSSTDLCLSIAGGDSFSDIYGLTRLLYIGLPQVLAILCRSKLVLLPQTIGPFQGKAGRWLAGFILRGASVVYSRDEGRADAIRKLGNLTAAESNKVRFCYDLGFDVDPSAPPEIDLRGFSPAILDDTNLVGLNVSGLLMDARKQFGFSMSYRDVVLGTLEYFLGQCNCPVLLVPHVLGPTVDGDWAICHELYESYRIRYPGRIGVVNRKYDYDEMKYLIGRSSFFVGARMHACIGALSQEVPVAAIAYSDKFEGVMQSVADGQRITVDLRKGSSQEAIAAVQDIYGRREQIRQELAQRIPQVKAVLANLLADV